MSVDSSPVNPYVLRSMSLEDLPQVLLIEQQCQLHPWSAKDFQSSIDSNHQAQVLAMDNGNSIVAYSVSSTAADEAELLTLAVAPAKQGQGLGKQLLDTVLNSFDETIHSIFLEVRLSNTRAIALYDSLGFVEVGLRNNYYPATKGREDALIMAKQLDR